MKKNGKKNSFKIIAFLLLVISQLFVPMSARAEDTSLQKIQEKGVLVIGTSADFPPYEFHTTIDGKDEIVGMDISIVEKIAKDLNVTLEIQDMEFDSLLPALESKKVDMVLAGMSPTAERQKNVDFSDVYYNSGHNIVIRKTDEKLYTDKNSLDGKKIGVQSGSLQEDLSDQIPNADLLKLGNLNDLLLSLKTNKVEAIIMERPNAEAHTGPDDEIITFSGEFEVEEEVEGAAIAMRKNSDSLKEAVNETLKEIKEKDLVQQYLATAGEHLEATSPEEEVSFMKQFAPLFLNGTLTTVGISLVSVLAGSILGIVLALMRLSDSVLFRGLSTAYVEFVRGTPMLIQVMFIYFAVGYVVNIPALASGIIAVSLNSGAYICEIIRSGLNSVSPGQTEAARSLGMNKTTSLRYIIFPQALKNIWPALGNEFITVIKESSIVSIIGVSELIFQTRVVTSISYSGILPLFVTMIIYFILTFSLTKLLNYYEGKMQYDNR